MAIDVKALVCPACGSPEVEMISEERGVCKACGVQFAVHPQDIIVQGEGNENGENEKIIVTKIEPKYSKDEFIRKAWIALAKENAPIEVFKGNFGEVSIVEHEILSESLTESGTYTADIGYIRDEAYTDYEKYYEEVPYQTTETYYDYNAHERKERTVTKYRKEERQRAVTRHRQITEWKPFSGNYSEESVTFVENNQETYLDTMAFVKSLSNVDEVADTSEYDRRDVYISNDALKAAYKEHTDNIRLRVDVSLPGDISKNLTLNPITISNQQKELFKVVEYEAPICFDGKNYTKRAFPFGDMYISGDEIENNEDPETIEENMREEQENIADEKWQSIDKRVWEKNKKSFFIAIALLLSSILTSCFIHVTFLVVLLFLAAGVYTIFSLLKIKKDKEEEYKIIEKEIEEDEEKNESEIANYAETYIKREYEALNVKLLSLGLKPADKEELE